METYNTPKQGIYYFSIPIFYGVFKRYSTPVEVIAKTDKSYQIVLKFPICGHHIGDKIWVKKSKVNIKEDVNEFWYSKD